MAETHAPGVGIQFPTAGFPGSPNATIPALPVGRKYHVALVLNQNGSTGQPGENGTARLYLDGQRVGSAPIVDGLFLDFMNDNNVWLGRSQWNDGTFAGRYNEFRIYNHALSAGEALFNAVGGPDNAAPGDANGDGTFADVHSEVLPQAPWFSMGTDVADVNNDGLDDLLTTDGRQVWGKWP